MLSNKWHLLRSNPKLRLSPTLTLLAPSVWTTNGSPSFSRYKKVDEPNFSITNTLLSQHFSPLFIKICSGLIPIFTLSPGETLSEVFGTIIFPCPEISTSVSELLELITLESVSYTHLTLPTILLV